MRTVRAINTANENNENNPKTDFLNVDPGRSSSFSAALPFSRIKTIGNLYTGWSKKSL